MDYNYFEEKLLAEKKRLEDELSSIGRRNPAQPGGWEAVPGEQGAVDTRDEVAERFEEYDERKATEIPLEGRLANVNYALKRIIDKTYGICEVGGEQIEKERLEINPAARTCLKHLAVDFET
jgi:RNA polymerase-binding transcription factor DksA